MSLNKLLSNYVMAFLNGGTVDGELILSQDSVALMFQDGHIGVIVMSNVWSYRVAFRGSAIRADLASRIDWH